MINKKLISVVVPAYNEEDNINNLELELQQVFNKENNYNFEIIVVENGSTDNTYNKLLQLNQKDNRFKVVRLVKNAGSDGGISAGLMHAKGDAAVILYADLQDPPETIHQFLRNWEEGFLNVFGVIEKRKDRGIIRSINSKLFYWLLYNLTGRAVPRNVGDFRLIDKSIYEAHNKIPEHNRFLRGIFAVISGKSIGVSFQRRERTAGESKAHSWYVVVFAIKAIFSFSYVPLSLITFFGIGTGFVAFIALIILVLKFVFYGVPFSGYGTLISVMLLLFGCMFIMMGIMGRYIAIICEEVKGRPNFIVQSLTGLDYNDTNDKSNN